MDRYVTACLFYFLTSFIYLPLQYFTWADRAGNSYRHPDSSLDPLLEVKMQERAEKEEREAREAKEAKANGKKGNNTSKPKAE
jgi:DNA invertase Pin-like site-specific DNA recombinase